MTQPETLESFHDAVVETIKRQKEHYVRKDGPGTDLAPMVAAHSAIDAHALMVLAPEKHDACVIGATMVALLRPCRLVYVTESYSLATTSDAEADRILDSLPGGSLAQAFAAGDQRVTEAITVWSFDPDGLMLDRLAYRYGDKRDVIWTGVHKRESGTYDQYKEQGQLQLIHMVEEGFSMPDDVGLDETIARRFEVVSASIAASYPDVAVCLATDTMPDFMEEEIRRQAENN